jgi:hypothetical protein
MNYPVRAKRPATMQLSVVIRVRLFVQPPCSGHLQTALHVAIPDETEVGWPDFSRKIGRAWRVSSRTAGGYKV